MKKILAALFVLIAVLSGCAPDKSEAPAPKKRISFSAVSQYPELPTGCEVTSLAMVLHYREINIDKCEIADKYLDKGEAGAVSYFDAFEGDPLHGDVREFEINIFEPCYNLLHKQAVIIK